VPSPIPLVSLYTVCVSPLPCLLLHGVYVPPHPLLHIVYVCPSLTFFSPAYLCPLPYLLLHGVYVYPFLASCFMVCVCPSLTSFFPAYLCPLPCLLLHGVYVCPLPRLLLHGVYVLLLSPLFPPVYVCPLPPSSQPMACCIIELIGGPNRSGWKQRIFTAKRNKGAFLDRKALRVSGCKDLRDALMVGDIFWWLCLHVGVHAFTIVVLCHAGHGVLIHARQPVRIY